MRKFKRELRRLPFFPLFPLLPALALIGLYVLDGLAFGRLRRLSRRIDALTDGVPSPT